MVLEVMTSCAGAGAGVVLVGGGDSAVVVGIVVVLVGGGDNDWQP